MRLCVALGCWSPVGQCLAEPPAAAASEAPSPAQRAEATRRSAWQRLATHIRRPGDIPPIARQELRVHSRRMARLSRVRALAEQAHDRTSVQRVDKLAEREQTRHLETLARLWPAATEAKAGGDEEPERGARPHEDEEDQEAEP